MTLVLKVGLGGLVGHVDAVAVDVELPAVVDAAQAGFFVAAEEQGRAAVRAVVLDQADLAVGVAEGDELLAEEQDPHGSESGVGAPTTAWRAPSTRA